MIRQKGTHTWDLYLHFEKCLTCMSIFENRINFKYQMGRYIKDLECPRCHTLFRIEKPSTSVPIGPIFGNLNPPEFDWS